MGEKFGYKESQPAQERVKRLTAPQQPNTHKSLGSHKESAIWQAAIIIIRMMIGVVFLVLLLGAGVFLIAGNSRSATLLALLGLFSLILLLLSSLLPRSQSVEQRSSFALKGEITTPVTSVTLSVEKEDYTQILRHIREQRGWSQAELADRLGTTFITIARWERGVTIPSPYFRKRLSKLFEEYVETHTDAYTDTLSPTEQKESTKLTQDLYSPLFFADMPLPEPSAFFGRARERSLLLDSVSKGGSFSVVGTRRMGKTWLLEYLCQIAPTELGERVTIGYVDAASSTCTTLTGFIEETLKAFGYYHDVPAHKRSSHLDLALLEQYTHSLREEWRLVILCIDNFDALTRYLKEFDRSFFEAMRAMAQRDLCLVVTSEKPLIRLLKESLHSSPFFNIFSQIKLLPFSETEASEFMRDNGQQAGFTSEEQEDLLKSSQDRTKQWPPLRLQLACKLLLEQKRAHETDPLVEDSVYWHNFNKQLDTQYRQLME